jgi:hypothetical protein
MKKKIIMSFFLLVTGSLFGQTNLGEVIGTVVDIKTEQPIYGAVAFIESGSTKYQVRTEYDGRFRISGIPSGTYIMQIRQYEDTMKNIIVHVPIDGFYQAGKIKFTSSLVTLTTMNVGPNKNEIKMISGDLPVKMLTAEEIDKSPLKFNMKGLIASMSSEIRLDDDGSLAFRGARKNDMLYLVDGVKTSQVGSVPGCSIGSMMVYTGGLPAKYGDTMGGVVVMESKSYFDLYRQWEADQIRSGNLD